MKKLLLFISLLIINFFMAGSPESSFTKINNDILINSTIPNSIITKTFTLAENQNVLIVADGRYFPYNRNGIAQVNIQIDNDNSYSSNAIIDWSNSLNAVQHTFNCIASAKLTAGTHTIKLIAFTHPSTPNTNFMVGGGTGLSILINPAPNIISSGLGNDSSTINYNTYPTNGFTPIPMTNILTNQMSVGEVPMNVVSLTSGRVYKDCGEGDALWGIFLNNENCTNNGTSLWSVNDITRGAELQAPMFQHSFHTLTGNNSISLKAGELSFTYFENAVCYKVGANTKLISLYGMNFSGKAGISDTYCNREEWKCFGSSIGTAGCPSVGSIHEVVSTDVNIPIDHNGVVLFLAKLRLQPDSNDIGGNAELWLNIDGVNIGTSAVQEFKKPNGDSSRTVSVSYLSAGMDKLSSGHHTVKVYLKANGSYKNISYSKDLPLIYFD
ncbi:hypothetical protein [Chryseobacterium rhizosphaerae]|uniref:hypothetical protein n=1 Tax=Chryseobacterium rhizosphaerae TaxID=395937 RepID=UPI002358BD53|nr:hypothetical protein [Chryseobacterium rhizosphaerae]MDC8098323.1 hypothetical protein [Chryseobacterium rhizosphaerae]